MRKETSRRVFAHYVIHSLLDAPPNWRWKLRGLLTSVTVSCFCFISPRVPMPLNQSLACSAELYSQPFYPSATRSSVTTRCRTQSRHSYRRRSSAIMDRMLNRRTFLKSSAASLPLAAAIQTLMPATISAETIAVAATSGTAPKLIPLPARLAPVDPSTLPWQQNIRRVGQSNMTEHDPAVMNIEEWADYWHSASADILFISVTGILAFYPSKVQFHRHGKFLNGRDFF